MLVRKTVIHGEYGGVGLRRRNIETIRLDDAEREVIQGFARELGVSRSEVWRRILVHMWILYQEDLSLKEALRESDELQPVHNILKGINMPLYKALKSVPELVEVLRRKGF